jgi:hypothetical protein
MPSGRRIGRKLFGNIHDVSFFRGTPTENDSATEFHEAILVWQGKGYPWKSAISGIPLNHSATRFNRPTDVIPFRPKQLYAEIEFLESLIELKNKEILHWEFIQLSDLPPVTAKGENEREFTRLVPFTCGVKTQKLIPHILSYFRKKNQWPKPLLRTVSDKDEYQIGGTVILMGRPSIPIEQLDLISCSELIIVPHITARGPNGIWSIQRGNMHPVIKSSKGLSAYCVINEHGQPVILPMPTPNYGFDRPFWTKARVLDLFHSRSKATIWARKLSKDFQEKMSVIEINGQELLSLLSHTDLVFTGDNKYALTLSGRLMLEDDEICSETALVANFLTDNSSEFLTNS